MGEKVQMAAKKPEVKRENLASKTRNADQSQSMSSPVDRVLYLQRTIGNQAVQRLIKSGALQAKLKIGQPGDRYEQEADRVADAVMRMPEPQVQRQPIGEEEEEKIQTKPVNEQFVQRQIEEEEEEEEGELRRQPIEEEQIQTNPVIEQLVQRQIEEEEEEQVQTKPVTEQTTPLVQRQVEEEEELRRQTAEDEEVSEIGMKSLGNGTDKAPEDIENILSQSKGGGSSLPDNIRSFMEQSIGADFSSVKIHNDGNAVQMSKNLNSQAFTHGSDIYFNRGKYNPSSSEGQHLLAHELTHVVQQGNRLQRIFLQRAPVEEPKKHQVIDYKKAKSENLKSWYDQYKFFKLFKEKKIYPGSTPIAYANHVYDLQKKLEEVYAGKWKLREAGILEPVITNDATIVKLFDVANNYHDDATADHGFDTKMLERIYKYQKGFKEKAPQLISEYFSGVRQLELVNRNKYFYIQFDDRGEYIKRLQTALLILNYDLGSDAKVNKETKKKEGSGVFSRGTKQAVINFQKDSGFEGKDVDGIVGQITLRLLDKRIGAPVYKAPSVSSGNAYAFHVPVTPSDLNMDKEKLKQDMLKRTLKVAFPITDDLVDVLVRSGWYWKKYTEPTLADVGLGYMIVTTSKSVYQSVITKIDETTKGKSGEPVEEKLETQTLDLLKTGKLYELNKKIRDMESLIWAERMSGDPEMHGRDVDWDSISKHEVELQTLKKERTQELNRLGISLEDYERMKTDFIHTFEKFAVLIAFRMLSENEMQADIEAQHYARAEEVTAIKAILSDLAGKYKESEKLWWEAVSLEDTNGKESSYYKNSEEYRSKNTRIMGMGVVDFSDPKRYYSEKNVAYMFTKEKNPSAYFTPWKEKEKNVVSTLQESVKKFPILAYPKLELRRNASKDAAMTDENLQKMLLGIIKGTDDEKGIKQNIEATRKELAENHDKIWELPVVIVRAQYELGVIDGVPADLIKAKEKAVANKGFWESIGLAVLGIGLGLLALASGPVGWLALGASIGVGAYEAYSTYSDITFKKETAGTAIDPASALGTQDPSYFWFWVSLVTIGLDVFQAAKLVKSVAKGIDLAEGVTKGLREARVAAEAKLLEAGESTAKGKAILKEIEEINSALSKVKSTEFAENIKLLEPLKSNPLAVVVMSEALRDKKIVRAVTSLGKLVDKEMFENAIKFYASVGRKSLDELPELMRLIKEGGLEANKRLMAELLSDPRTQRVLLDTQDPAFVAAQFKAWEDAITAGKSQSFVKYLEAENLTTKLASDIKLVDMFGEAFATLPNVVKNRQIMRTVEPRLLDAFNAGTLSPEIKKALDVLFNSDVLAQSSKLSSAQVRMLREIRLLGSVIETQSDFSKVVSLLDNPTSRRALWEGASQLAGKDKYIEIIFKANGGKLPAPDVLDDLIRIGPMTDENMIQSLLKPAGQKLRQVLAANPEAVAVLKKCASFCFPPFITAEQVELVNAIMKGKSRGDLRQIREFLYANRGSEDGFKSALKNLETNLSGALKDVELPVFNKPRGLDVADETLQRIENLGLPVSEINKIMKNAAEVRGGGSEIMSDLMQVLQLEKHVSLNNFHILLDGLAKGSKVEFSAARHLLDVAQRFNRKFVVGAKNFRFKGLEMGDVLLGRFTLTELESMMKARWTEDFVVNLYYVVDKMPGLKSSEIIDLISKAGGGKAPGDLGRLYDILSTIKAPATTYDEAVKAIQAADSFARDVAKAMKDPATGYDALAKLIWGEKVVVEEGTIKVTIKVTELLGKSGSDVYQTVFQLGKGESLAKKMAKGGVLSKEKWKVFRKVIEDANIATSIKNSIIGEMWTRVNEEVFSGLGYNVIREVEITDGKVVAKADIILEKGNEIIVVECKSGGGVYSAAQKIIYPLLQEGKFKSVMLRGDEALAKKFSDPKTKIGFRLASDLDIIK